MSGLNCAVQVDTDTDKYRDLYTHCLTIFSVRDLFTVVLVQGHKAALCPADVPHHHFSVCPEIEKHQFVRPSDKAADVPHHHFSVCPEIEKHQFV